MGVVVPVRMPVVMRVTVGMAMSVVLVGVERDGNHAEDVIL